ncbi:SWI/SNF related, matrix associated, actin dependent regulator of chromatin, subfamily a, member 4a isoform X1 [Lates japonicus]|uniref:SWI/SNF related, matrix associated, actin dependent regulator of chromatin, subfamily a, member 4a isoform X1 n=1 Tax=Lates japonicus TaxID=270547 RepID=A0AAD3N5G7_LATJO|nr:SWI/SNF related, matrix associated, actin dependent regulator of chromatin, subfamily a, member 4a isoform X1 [Lates japonicus]
MRQVVDDLPVRVIHVDGGKRRPQPSATPVEEKKKITDPDSEGVSVDVRHIIETCRLRTDRIGQPRAECVCCVSCPRSNSVEEKILAHEYKLNVDQRVIQAAC